MGHWQWAVDKPGVRCYTGSSRILLIYTTLDIAEAN